MNKTAFLNLYVETSQPQNTENLETDVKIKLIFVLLRSTHVLSKL